MEEPLDAEPPWYAPHLDAYRDERSRSLDELERGWRRYAVPASAARSAGGWRETATDPATTSHLLRLIEGFFEPADAFTYLEFGTGFGSNLGSVLQHFRNARAIGVEPNGRRLAVTRWLTRRVDAAFDLADRLELHESTVVRAPLAPHGIDVVFMNTEHRYPEGYAYVAHLLDGGFLRDGFLFVGVGPMSDGTRTTRERLTRDRFGELRVLTRADWNLWWFYRTGPSRLLSRVGAT